LNPGVKIADFLAQNANAQAVILLSHSVSPPTKLHPTLQKHNHKKHSILELYAMEVQQKSTGAKAASRRLMQLIPR
jgi:hypothetical protein